jgi:hypothetical protein
MKTLLAVILATCYLVSGVFAQPAGSNAVQIIWSAPTNDWPSSLWIYKIVPQTFSPAVVSNLVSMISFKIADTTNAIVDTGAGKARVLDFESVDGKSYLQIWPEFGYIEYQDSAAEAPFGQLSAGVPTDEEAYPLALDCLRKFGIDRSQLATRPSTNGYTGKSDFGIRRLLGTRGWADKKLHKTIHDTNSCGIFFVRRVDGFDVDGITHGGVTIVFGLHAKISELKITWPGLEPYLLRPTLAPEQIIDRARIGQIRWRPYGPSTDIKKITVFGYDIFYRGQPGQDDLENPQRLVDPYVMIYAACGDGSTNDLKCYAEMPIFPKE